MFKDLGIPQDNTGYPEIQDWDFQKNLPLGTSQDSTGYPGIPSIQALGCLGISISGDIPGHYWLSRDI